MINLASPFLAWYTKANTFYILISPHLCTLTTSDMSSMINFLNSSLLRVFLLPSEIALWSKALIRSIMACRTAGMVVAWEELRGQNGKTIPVDRSADVLWLEGGWSRVFYTFWNVWHGRWLLLRQHNLCTNIFSITPPGNSDIRVGLQTEVSTPKQQKTTLNCITKRLHWTENNRNIVVL